MKQVLVIDNYDSFTYNLVHYLEALDCDVTVIRNDQFTLWDITSYQKIVLSPGPGLPGEAGLLKPLIKHYAPTKSILGVCLGMQAIAEVYGGRLLPLHTVYHGVATKVRHFGKDPLFKGVPETFMAGRYHSWIVDPDLPATLKATAFDEHGQLMSLRHIQYDICGVQYHPESILTSHGKKILQNWLI